MINELVHIPDGPAIIEGMLEVPENAQGIVLFAHGSGSSRLSPRNNYVAKVLRQAGIGTLLMDLLTVREDETYEHASISRCSRAGSAWLRLGCNTTPHKGFAIGLLRRQHRRSSGLASSGQNGRSRQRRGLARRPARYGRCASLTPSRRTDATASRRRDGIVIELNQAPMSDELPKRTLHYPRRHAPFRGTRHLGRSGTPGNGLV